MLSSMLLKIRKNYYGQKGNVRYHETLTSWSWERHGRNDDRSKGTVIMGLTSGRGRRGARRRTGGRASDGPRHTSLVGGGQRGGYRADDGYADQRGYGQPDGYGHPGYYGNPGEYGHPGQYRPPGEYGNPGEYGRPMGYAPPGRPRTAGTVDGRVLSTELDLGDGPRAGRGRLAAFLPGSGRGHRAGTRRHGGRALRGTHVPVLAVVAVVASLAVVAAAVGVTHILTGTTAADATPAVDTNCTLIVPANPLSAQGLATPYQLTATDPAAGPCNEANSNQTAFVQGAVIDPGTGKISIYDPLVVDAGTQPAAAPVAPTLPAGAVVAVWFGFNGNTLTLAGADQAQSLLAPSSAAATATAGATPAATPSATSSQAQDTPTASTSATATPTSTATGTSTATATPTATGTSAATATAAATYTGSAPRAATEVVGAAPVPPANGSSAGDDGTLSSLSGSNTGSSLSGNNTGSSQGGNTTSQGASTGHRHPSPAVSPSATKTASPTASATGSATASPAASASTATPSGPPVSAGDSPAASGTPDTILQQADCVAGEDIQGQFSSFTQVGACNSIAFFAAANAAIKAGKLTVPAPGTAKDGQSCLTTRSFALIDQDQSDNVTTEYLAQPDGQTAQDTAANKQALGGASVLFNGSDNGLLDLFVDPALGCSPWEAPNLADAGAPAPSLPLDELQAAAWAGRDGSGPAALVPLNDPMTLDNNGQFSTDKTNTYRSIVDMPSLPAGESPAAYCSDMEQIQGKRLQQDANLLIGAPSPMPAAADNLFTFMAMRVQQSFVNLNCGNFGQQNDVSTSVDGNGVVVAACFLQQYAAVTSGPGNPMAGQTSCPANVSSAPSGMSSPSPSAGMPSAKPSSGAPGSSYHRHHRQHWWW
jgi:hypothetical protein